MHFQQFLWGSTLLSAAVTAIPSPNQHHPSRWVNLTSLPSPRQEHVTVAINNSTIAVVGGIERLGNDVSIASPNTHPILLTPPQSIQTGIRTTPLLSLYDIPSNTWHPGAPLPLPINHPNGATSNNRIYLLGGLIDAQNPPPMNGADWLATGKSYVYDLATDTWRELPPMPPGTERGSAVTGVYGEMIYVVGGMTYLSAAGQDAVTSVIAFNTTSEKWQRVASRAADIPSGRQHAVGGVVGSTLYVLGGRWYERTNVRDEVFSLDLLQPERGWQTSKARMPTARGGITGGAVGNSFYVFGGECDEETANGVFPQNEAYDLKKKKWTRLANMAVPRHGTSAVAVGKRVYVPGGGLQQDGLPVERDGVVSYGEAVAHFDAFEVGGY